MKAAMLLGAALLAGQALAQPIEPSLDASATSGEAASAPFEGQPEAEAAQARFVLSPHLAHLQVCDVAQADPKLLTMADIARVCQGLGDTSVATLTQVLDAIEPGGAQGAVQVGYTLTLPLLGLMRAEGDDWVIDEARIRPMLALIEGVNRPVVVHLSSSHFDTQGPLPEALRQNPINFMQYADGSVPQLRNLGDPISAYTLLTDESIPVNQYRFKALRELAALFGELSDTAKSRIVGYTLGGEFHQMYPDFEHGAGQFGVVKVTDYSPQSVAAFRDWLRVKWGSARKLASETGLKLDDFETVDAPRANLNDGSARHWREHYDAYASGRVPIAGWLHDPKGHISKLMLYLNGKPVGEVQRGYNRLDVYRANDEVMTPNVGFRYDLDVSRLAAGPYLAQVVALVGDRSYELTQTTFTLVSRTNSGNLRAREPEGARRLEMLEPEGNWLERWWQSFLRTIGWAKTAQAHARVPDVTHSLDLPGNDLRVHYNPLAREWDEFRNAQVLSYMQALFSKAVEAGFPADKLYSHQINDRVNSAWNAQLFAVDDVWASSHDWQNGMNLYGGGTSNDMVMRFISRSNRQFAAPEFHTQQWKVKEVPLQTLKTLRDAGVRFVSPYYLSLAPEQLRAGQPENGVNRMELRLDNPRDGSDLLYQAMQDLAKQ